MDSVQLFTLQTLGTISIMILAVRLWVEYTKDYADLLTGNRLPTALYSLLVSYVLLYGVGALTHTLGNGMWFAHVFNGPLVAGTAGILGRKPTPALVPPVQPPAPVTEAAASIEAPAPTTEKGAS